MPPRSPLPPPFLRGPFTVGAARAAGISAGRLRGRDLAVPFRGVRISRFDSRNLDDRCRALATRLAPGSFFSHGTAALIMRFPLPLAFEANPTLHVAIAAPGRAFSRSGVVSHQFRTVPEAPRDWNGLRVSAPVHTWCLLASQLSVPDLVAVGDVIVTGDHPLATIAELTAAAASWEGHRGARALAAAARLVRVGPLSRPESHARLLFAAAGLPEPELNGRIFDSHGRFLAMSDLVWREWRVAWEYEGNHHWSDAAQFRRDIIRRERVEDSDWRIVRFTADDLRIRPAETVARLASRLGLAVTPSGLSAAVALSAQFGR